MDTYYFKCGSCGHVSRSAFVAAIINSCPSCARPVMPADFTDTEGS